MTKAEVLQRLFNNEQQYDWVLAVVREKTTGDHHMIVIEEIDNALNIAIKALQQELKRGEWERFNHSDGDVMECTNCGYRDWRDRWLEDEVHNYCPNCGARME